MHAVGSSVAHVGVDTMSVALGWSRGLESLLQENHDAALADVPFAPPKFLSDSDRAQINADHVLREDAHLSHGEESANLPNRSPFRGIFLPTFPLNLCFSVSIPRVRKRSQSLYCHDSRCEGLILMARSFMLFLIFWVSCGVFDNP